MVACAIERERNAHAQNLRASKAPLKRFFFLLNMCRLPCVPLFLYQLTEHAQLPALWRMPTPAVSLLSPSAISPKKQQSVVYTTSSRCHARLGIKSSAHEEDQSLDELLLLLFSTSTDLCCRGCSECPCRCVSI